MGETSTSRPRLLIVDDNPAIHDDFRKILRPDRASTPRVIDVLESELFGHESTPSKPAGPELEFEIASAHQGEESLRLTLEAMSQQRPFSVAFVDIRMPPGWDGIETSVRLLQADPDMQLVICTAHSDYDWDEITAAVGPTDRVLILKKPFDAIEVRQLGHSLHRKWTLIHESANHVDELERRVAERTRELAAANERLRSEMAERLRVEAELRLSQKLQTIGQLAAGIAHEIKTPLQFVGGNIEFLKESYDRLRGLVSAYATVTESVKEQNPQAARVIANAEEDAELPFLDESIPVAASDMQVGLLRIASIVESLREFGRVDALEKIPTDINRLIQNTLTLTRSAVSRIADVEMSLGEIPVIECHAGELGQVMMNLLINAAQAIETTIDRAAQRGTISITSCLDGGHIDIAVADTGCGIPAAIRERIFDPFFTTKEVGKGTGQGLALAWKTVVDRHQGSLTFETQPGRGTTFHVRIPVTAPNMLTVRTT
jgi:signal transduction histidine kinase